MSAGILQVSGGKGVPDPIVVLYNKRIQAEKLGGYINEVGAVKTAGSSQDTVEGTASLLSGLFYLFGDFAEICKPDEVDGLLKNLLSDLATVEGADITLARSMVIPGTASLPKQ